MKFPLCLARVVTRTRKDVPQCGDTVSRHRIRETAAREIKLCLHILESEDPGGVHQKEPDAEELLQALDAALNNNHAWNAGEAGARQAPMEQVDQKSIPVFPLALVCLLHYRPPAVSGKSQTPFFLLP